MRHKHLQEHASTHSGLIKKNRDLFGVAVSLLVLVIVFLATRGGIPNSSELSYIEHSSLGKYAGSVVPASCDSASPFTSPTAAGGTAGSHFNGDCQTPCPGGSNGGNYDPYFDPTASTCTKTCPSGSVISYTATCPAPSVNIWFGN